jgi:hypothetical protein
MELRFELEEEETKVQASLFLRPWSKNDDDDGSLLRFSEFTPNLTALELEGDRSIQLKSLSLDGKPLDEAKGDYELLEEGAKLRIDIQRCLGSPSPSFSSSPLFPDSSASYSSSSSSSSLSTSASGFPSQFRLDIETVIRPQNNTSLYGLYKSR